MIDRLVEWLRPHLRAAVTLVVLAVAMLLALAIGWAALTEPLPDFAVDDSPSVCEPRQVAAGQRVRVGQVTVSVFNAGRTEGRARETMSRLILRGFGQGQTGNAPPDTEVRRVQVWAPDPDNPAVRLVRSHLGRNVKVVSRERRPLGAGVVVVVGDGFAGLVRGEPSVRAGRPARICSPVA